jgi:hypothetical protein
MTNEQRELVDQLRYRPVGTTAAQMREAATTIEQLAERCERLEAALRKMASVPCAIPYYCTAPKLGLVGEPMPEMCMPCIARAALNWEPKSWHIQPK